MAELRADILLVGLASRTCAGESYRLQ